jgi:cytochrome c oxidase assembly protein subunit 15
MTDTPAIAVSRRRVVRLWLLTVAALMVVVVLVGGATRLTESGLSIVEWKPVVGIVPPLSVTDWRGEFEKYQAIPQYRERNAGMTLDEFKTIFWWEWTHRLLARTVGFVFLLPFAYFLWRGWIERGLRARLWTIFGLGGALGVVGWWMVSSGLSERISVSQYRLAFHLTLACTIYAAIVWTAQRLVARPVAATPIRLRAGALGLVGLVILQIYLGALVAGLDAGLTYNTWPLIDGAFIPDTARLFFETPLWRNFFENILTVQFEHRMLAYTLLLAAVLHAADALRSTADKPTQSGAVVVALAVATQAALGIVTLLHVAPLSLSLMHQGMAIVVLTLAVLHAERLKPCERRVIVHEPLAAAGAKT